MSIVGQTLSVAPGTPETQVLSGCQTGQVVVALPYAQQAKGAGGIMLATALPITGSSAYTLVTGDTLTLEAYTPAWIVAIGSTGPPVVVTLFPAAVSGPSQAAQTAELIAASTLASQVASEIAASNLPSGVAGAITSSQLATDIASNVAASGLPTNVANEIVASALSANIGTAVPQPAAVSDAIAGNTSWSQAAGSLSQATGNQVASGATWSTGSSSNANANRLLTPWESGRTNVSALISNISVGATGFFNIPWSTVIVNGVTSSNTGINVPSGAILRIQSVMMIANNLSTSGATAAGTLSVWLNGASGVEDPYPIHWQTAADNQYVIPIPGGFELAAGLYYAQLYISNISASTTAYFSFKVVGYYYYA